jgi:hypothetical protein
VDGTFFDFKIEAAKDLLAADDAGMEVVDDETHKGWLEKSMLWTVGLLVKLG